MRLGEKVGVTLVVREVAAIIVIVCNSVDVNNTGKAIETYFSFYYYNILMRFKKLFLIILYENFKHFS